MTAFLTKSGEAPISVADIKLELGLSGDDLDLIIAAGIALHCTAPGCRPETWMIERTGTMTDLDVQRKAQRIGGRVVSIAPARKGWKDRDWHDVELGPKPEAIRAARAKIMRWALDQDDIHGALVRQEMEQRAGMAVAAE